MYLNFSNFWGRTSAGGGQALVQKWGQVSDGGIDKIFARWEGPPVPPGKNPGGVRCISDGGHKIFVAEIGGSQFYQRQLFVNLGPPFRRK